jgi:hypothetical protein
MRPSPQLSQTTLPLDNTFRFIDGMTRGRVAIQVGMRGGGDRDASVRGRRLKTVWARLSENVPERKSWALTHSKRNEVTYPSQPCESC